MTSKVTRLMPDSGMDDPGPGPLSGQDARAARPDPEVPERARRRTFTAKYKLEILAAYDAAADGEKGALLRREGLYSSHIVAWRRARDAGGLAALAAPRGRKTPGKRGEENAALQAEREGLGEEVGQGRVVGGGGGKKAAHFGTRFEEG